MTATEFAALLPQGTVVTEKGSYTIVDTTIDDVGVPFDPGDPEAEPPVPPTAYVPPSVVVDVTKEFSTDGIDTVEQVDDAYSFVLEQWDPLDNAGREKLIWDTINACLDEMIALKNEICSKNPFRPLPGYPL